MKATGLLDNLIQKDQEGLKRLLNRETRYIGRETRLKR